ncbi:MAG: hypothetical protein AAGU27_16090 [Dehalobacterium sp.]
MDQVQEINTVLKQLIEELQLQPYGLDVFLENFDAREVVWTVRMKKHYISISAEEISSIRKNKDSLYAALKDLFLEKFQWLT